MWENRLNAWRPARQMEDLLRAVLVQDPRWKEAWAQWRQSANLDRLEPGAFRLMPLLYKRLKSEGVDDPWMGRLQGIYRHTWARNQMLMRDALLAANALAGAGIPVMLIKGAAMILAQYHDGGLCPAVDMDLLVPTPMAAAAVRSLREAGFSATSRYEGDLPERFLRIGFSHPFRSPRGNEIDLHWHLLFFRSFAGADESFWEHAVRAEVQGFHVLLPSPTDMLLVSCLHGLCWSSTSSLRWAADACLLIRNFPIDWNRLGEYARWPGVALPLRLALHYLRETLEVPIPDVTLRGISSERTTVGDRWVLMTYSGPENLLWNTLSIWFRHARFSRNKPAGFFRLLSGLPSFLAAYWALPSVWQTPGLALRKIARRFRLASPKIP
jgi:hypothetical protein